jgi:hypothetical protein
VAPGNRSNEGRGTQYAGYRIQAKEKRADGVGTGSRAGLERRVEVGIAPRGP